MPSTWIKTLPLGLLLLAASAGAARQPSDKTGDSKGEKAPSKLEQTLAQALKNNPDIRVAEAKAHEAEAELARTRLAVAQKVVTLLAQLEAQEKVVEEAQERYQRLRKIGAPGAVSEEDMRAAAVALQKAKADLAVLQAQLPYLVGKEQEEGAKGTGRLDGRGVSGFTFREGLDRERQVPQGAAADKIRAALDKPVTLKGDKRLGAVLEYLGDVSGLQLQLRPDTLIKDTVLSDINLKEVPLGAVLQYLEDNSGHPYRFVVRDYGLLFCPAADLPPGAVLLSDFRKGAAEKPGEKPGANPAPEGLQGGVLSTEEGGFLKVNLGSDSGLQKGHTLEVFRLDPDTKKAAYVGRVLVVEVRPKDAVCRTTGRMTGPVKAGDHVASRLTGQ